MRDDKLWCKAAIKGDMRILTFYTASMKKTLEKQKRVRSKQQLSDLVQKMDTEADEERKKSGKKGKKKNVKRESIIGYDGD